MRVVLLLVGSLIYGVLYHYFEVPRTLAIIAGGLPFGLAEARGAFGPYEKTASELMHESSESKPEDK